MIIIAYLYSDPLLESPPNPEIWGVEVDKVYQDIGSRQELERLFQDCQVNSPKYLLLRRLDELGESIKEIGNYLGKLESLGIEIITTEQSYTSSQINHYKPTDLKANLADLVQEIQEKQRSRMIELGHARNRINILPPPGKAPYGYRRGKDRYLIDRSTAPIVKDFFDYFLLYGSLRKAVRYLENRYGKKIAVSTGRYWLKNPVYRGNLEYKNNEIIPNTHIPILSKEEAAQIDRILRRNQGLASRTASAPRSLAGLVICDQCQSKMTISKVTSRNKKQEYLYLRGINCPLKKKCKTISYKEVLKQTIERICQDLPLEVAKINFPIGDSITEKINTEITQKEEIIQQLPQLINQKILDEETAQIRRYKLLTEIGKLQAQLAQLPPVNLKTIAQTISIPQFWLDLSESERRFYFREFIRQIKIIRQGGDNWDLQLVFIF